jgi:GDPmannose 4,6-dehydratase
MWLMLQQAEPDDYVVATGASHSVRDFVEHCFAHVGLDWQDHVRFDERYLRPTEVDDLVGDATKAERVLGWRPTVRAPELARLMVDAEIAAHEPEPLVLDRRPTPAPLLQMARP